MDKPKVAVVILTKDRPEFIIRQLEYYKNMNSLHPVYILDSSNTANADKIKNYISNCRGKIIYLWIESGNQPLNKVLDICKEKYFCFSGDDDYQIPDSLIACAEFLENNSDFVSCGGRAVAVRLEGNGVYGQIKRISDYTRQELLDELPQERFLNLMNNYCVYLFNVTRVEIGKKMWDYLPNFSDQMVEIYPVSRLAIAGKIKLIDNLQFIRQIHDSHNDLGTAFEWLVKDFKESYAQVKRRLPIPEKYIKQGFETIVRKTLNREYRSELKSQKTNIKTSAFRIVSAMFKKIPLFKKIYRRYIKPTLHWEVVQKDSKYFDSFYPVQRSLTACVRGGAKGSVSESITGLKSL